MRAAAYGETLTRAAARARQQAKVARLRARHRAKPGEELVRLGAANASFNVPLARLGPDSVVYAAGVGQDISFELELIARTGCAVRAYDPVPAAASYAQATAAGNPLFDFTPAGLWSEDGTLRFYSHRRPDFVSHSATNMHGTEAAVEAPVRSLDSLMREHGHDHVDLLKLSVEGSEYEIVRDLVAKGIRVGILCVEFAQPAPVKAAIATLDDLERAGYELVDLSLLPWAWRAVLVSR
jgi:FkbM family methyltransferase